MLWATLAPDGRTLLLLGAAGAVLAGGCRREAFHGPLALLERPTVEGRLARSHRLALGGAERNTLVETAAYRVLLPRRALLTFGVGVTPIGNAPAQGSFRLSVRAAGRPVWRRSFPASDTFGFEDFGIAFDGDSRVSSLELELRPQDGAGRDALLGVSEPTLHDLEAYGSAKGVILVSIDTLRRDHVGAYGYPRPTTPRLDALAREGLLCEDAVSTSSWTLPAHLSMLTALDAGAHGGLDADHGFNRGLPTLPALLRQAGLATAAVTSHLYVSSLYGLDEGFESFDFVEDRPAEDVATRAIALLDRLGDRPFFLLLHFYDPHAHYNPPPATRALFPSPYRGALKGLLPHFQQLRPEEMPPGYLEHLRSLYDGEIRSVDDQLGRILDHMRERRLDRSTLLLVTSDHGEEFLDHGGWTHGRTLYEEIIRVPLVVHGPGVAPRRESAQASLLDVAPTVLDWLGLEPLEYAQGQSLLRPLGEREAFGDKGHVKGGVRKLFLRGGQRGWKLILSLHAEQDRVEFEEWFQLGRDPEERRPATPDHATATAMRRRALTRWREGRDRGGAGPGVGLTPEQVERLRALGYLGS